MNILLSNYTRTSGGGDVYSNYCHKRNSALSRIKTIYKRERAPLDREEKRTNSYIKQS